jgi:hypothetical protein
MRAARLTLAALGAGIAIGVLAGRWVWHEPRPMAPPAAAEAAEAPAARSTEGPRRDRQAPRRKLDRPFLVRPAELCVATDHEAERRYRVQQSRELVDLLFVQLGMFEKFFPDAGPEAAATQMRLYQKGLADAIMRTAPDLTDELADQIEQTLCDPQARASQLASLARLFGDIPELASERGFDCVFGQRAEEDVVLWSMLDAWRVSKLPRPPSLIALERDTKDGRVRERLTELAEFEARARLPQELAAPADP